MSMTPESKNTPPSPGPSPRPPPTPSPVESFLQYGDIIQITADTPDHPLHDKTFLVDYLDDDQIRIVNTVTQDTLRLQVDDDGQLTNPHIRRIELLTRAAEPGFARQHGLLVDQWVDVYFLGVPTPLTGKITHLEEDQIELTLHPSQEMVYIDFRYRGLPDDLGIEKFVLRSSPPEVGPTTAAESVAESAATSTASIEYTDDNESIVRLPDKIVYDTTVDDDLRAEYLEANEIVFGKDQDILEQFVEYTTHEKVFSLDTQLTSLMNELLSNIPNHLRNYETMNQVHHLLERFRQLREQYSTFDPQTHQVVTYTQKGLSHRPLVDHLATPVQTGVPLSWLVPVTQSRRKIYPTPDDDPASGMEDMGDTVIQSPQGDQMDLVALVSGKVQGGNTVNPYTWMLQELSPYFDPTVNLPVESWSEYVQRRPVLVQTTIAGDHPWESIVDNGVDRDYTASTVHLVRQRTRVDPVKFFMDRRTAGTAFLERSPTNRRQFVSSALTPHETLPIQSWVTLPYAVAQFARCRLPGARIAERAQANQYYWMKFRTFPLTRDTASRRGHPEVFTIEDLETNYFSTKTTKTKKEDETKTSAPSSAPTPPRFMRGTRQYVLDPQLLRDYSTSDPDLYRAYLEAMTPATLDLVELVQPYINMYGGLSTQDMLHYLEPFLVYADDLTYTQMNRLRYFIRQRITQYRRQFQEDRDRYLKIAGGYTRVSQPLENIVNPVQEILDTGSNYDNHFTEVYRIPALLRKKEGAHPLTGSELLVDILGRDQARLFAMLLRSRTLTYVVSEAILSSALEEYDEEQKKTKNGTPTAASADCRRQFLTKRYTSLAELQKDNHHEEVYYDTDFDDTPYKLLDLYQADLPEKSTDLESPAMKEFLELLEENLIRKHGVDRTSASELATTLVRKKKPVRDGEYALLEIAQEIREQDLEGDQDRRFMAAQREFYKRIKNQWVKDDTVNEEAFADMSYLAEAAFPHRRTPQTTSAPLQATTCAIQEQCVKRPQTAVCDSMDHAQATMHRIRQKYAIEEMEKRLQMTQKELEEWIKDQIVDTSRRLVATERLRYVQSHKASLVAYQLGKIFIEHKTADLTPSPYLTLFHTIMSQDDFYKKQHDVVRFVKKGLVRSPMIEELGEDRHWLYCTQTNTKVLPVFLYDLALAYITLGEAGYQDKLEEIKRFQMISDDGDAIVDKYSGYVISKIEYVREDLYDEHGFKIQTARALPTDPDDSPVTGPEDTDAHPGDISDPPALGVLTADGLGPQVHTEMVRNIFLTYCHILDIPAKDYQLGFQEFVCRVSLELVNETLLTREAFTLMQSKKMDPAKIPERYLKYYHQYLVIITTAVFLIGVQTSQPRIQAKKTVPGCVRSFTGYPLTESTDDQRGIEYMACILNIVKSSIPPWDAIQRADRKDIVAKLREKITEILDKRKDVYERYVKERAYRETHPEAYEVPRDLELGTWRGLYPPMVNIDIVSRLPVERTDMGQPSKLIAQSKTILYGCGVIEAITKIVREKDLLLTTSLGIPFVQNACCNDATAPSTLAYFIGQNPLIGTFLGHIDYYGRLTDTYIRTGQPATWVSTIDTRIPRGGVLSGNLEEIVYQSFIHYCQFDRPDIEIPAHLRAICPTKPAPEAYRPRGTLREKIQALKSTGKVFHLEDFEQLIRKVNYGNLVRPDLKVAPRSAVQLLTDFLAATDSPVLAPLRQELMAVLVKYDPQVMVMEKRALLVKYDPELMAMGTPQEGEGDAIHVAVMKLKNRLAKENDTLKTRIVKFLKDYAGLKRTDLAKMKETVETLPVWAETTTSHPTPGIGEDTYEMAQFLRNSVTLMVKVVPEMILNRQFHVDPTIHKHWDLAPSHVQILQDLIRGYWSPYTKFANDDTQAPFYTLLREIQGRLADIVLLTNLIPVQRTIQRDQDTWFRLFDRSTLHLLLSHTWYTTLDQYIQACNQAAQNNTYLMVVEGLKKQVAGLLMTFVGTFQRDKQDVDQSYAAIMKKVNRAKDREKEQIMGEFEKADKKDRRYMFLEKMWKHGRWNVGIQNGLVRYDKTRFEYERTVMELEIDQGNDPEGEPEIRYEEPGDEAGEEGRYEENDIEDLDEDYRDGDYYGEDDGEEVFDYGDDA